MNAFAKSLILIGGVVSLSACASCPREDDYNRTPYGNRTSGSGVAVYDGHCQRTIDSTVATHETVETTRDAEPVFNERVRK